MTRELIMDALNRCEPYVIPECCSGCPYEGCWGTKEECITQLHADAYALLKAHEPMKPTLKGKEPYNYYCCGACDSHISIKDKYCPQCGKAVKWK